MRKLKRAAFCEEYAVARTQTAHLAFIVRAEVRVFSRLVDEPVPDIDIDHTGALGAAVVRAFIEAGATCHIPAIESSPPTRNLPDSQQIKIAPSIDLADEASVDSFYAKLPPLHAVVNIAGGFQWEKLEDGDPVRPGAFRPASHVGGARRQHQRRRVFLRWQPRIRSGGQQRPHNIGHFALTHVVG